MRRGRVRTYHRDKGYGTIVPDDGGPEVFVHYATIEDFGFQTLRAGQVVEFEARDSELGPRATLVRPIAVDSPTAESASGSPPAG